MTTAVILDAGCQCRPYRIVGGENCDMRKMCLKPVRQQLESMLKAAFIPVIVLWPILAFPAASSPALDEDGDIISEIRQLPPRAANEVIWLARCIYSESNRAHEQQLVAWVVRNRVETQFRGRSYREVILTPRQFSAFNQPSPRRRRILNLTLDSKIPGWETALDVAYRVYTAPPEERPFPQTTRHFYSPVSMSSDDPPPWTDEHTPISPSSLGVLPHRFQFYDGIDQRDDQPEMDPNLAEIRRFSSTSAQQTSDRSQTSLKELRRSIRRRVVRGRVERPRRPTVQPPSRPDRGR